MIQYCRACGTDLRAIRIGLEPPDDITAAAKARDHISRAIADKIREAGSSDDLKKIAEDVLPEIEKFLESPNEKRLRRVRTGVIFAAIGLGGGLISFLLALENNEFLPVLLPCVVMFFIGLGIILNGVFFTRPRSETANQMDSALAQRELDLRRDQPESLNPQPISEPRTHELDEREKVPLRTSVTEHTTHQLKQDRS